MKIRSSSHQSFFPVQGNMLMRYLHRLEDGFSLAQMMITISIVGILSAIAIPSISIGVNPLGDTSNRLKSQIKLARIKAMSTTTAYRLKPTANNKIEIQRHAKNGSSLSTCNHASLEIDSDGNPLWTGLEGYSDEDFLFEDGVRLTRVSVDGTTNANLLDWNLCFNSRGISNHSIELEFTEASTGETMKLMVLMGGSVNIGES